MMNEAITKEIQRIREMLASPASEWRKCRCASSMDGVNISLDRYNREFFPELHQKFIDIYEKAAKERKLIRPKFELYGPDSGWIDIRVTTDKGDSDYYPVSDYQGDYAFYEIIEWLEILIKEDSAFRIVDAEDIYALFGFERIDENRGLFVFASGSDKITGFGGICNKNEIIKGLYEAIMYFSSGPKVNTPKYNVYWRALTDDSDFDIYDVIGQDLYDEDCENGTPLWRDYMIFHEVYRSEIIENYLKKT